MQPRTAPRPAGRNASGRRRRAAPPARLLGRLRGTAGARARRSRQSARARRRPPPPGLGRVRAAEERAARWVGCLLVAPLPAIRPNRRQPRRAVGHTVQANPYSRTTGEDHSMKSRETSRSPSASGGLRAGERLSCRRGARRLRLHVRRVPPARCPCPCRGHADPLRPHGRAAERPVGEWRRRPRCTCGSTTRRRPPTGSSAVRRRSRSRWTSSPPTGPPGRAGRAAAAAGGVVGGAAAPLLLRGVKEELRGGDYAWVTLRFERAGEVALQMHAQTPTYVDEDATPGLTPPSPEQ